jgi:hypothetical protein
MATTSTATETPIAEIRFGAGCITVQKRSRVIDGVLCRFRGSDMFDYAAGETAEQAAKRVARIFVARLGGEVAVRRTLRRIDGGCELPNPTFTRFGWTRETRGRGEVSVIPDVYLVF